MLTRNVNRVGRVVLPRYIRCFSGSPPVKTPGDKTEMYRRDDGMVFQKKPEGEDVIYFLQTFLNFSFLMQL